MPVMTTVGILEYWVEILGGLALKGQLSSQGRQVTNYLEKRPTKLCGKIQRFDRKQRAILKFIFFLDLSISILVSFILWYLSSIQETKKKNGKSAQMQSRAAKINTDFQCLSQHTSICVASTWSFLVQLILYFEQFLVLKDHQYPPFLLHYNQGKLRKGPDQLNLSFC